MVFRSGLWLYCPIRINSFLDAFVTHAFFSYTFFLNSHSSPKTITPVYEHFPIVQIVMKLPTWIHYGVAFVTLSFFFSCSPEFSFFPKKTSPLFLNSVRFGWKFLHRLILIWHLWRLNFFFIPEFCPLFVILPLPLETSPLFLNAFPLFDLNETS